MTAVLTCSTPAPGPGPLTEAEAATVLRHLMIDAYGVAVQWLSVDRLSIVACTSDPILAALAATVLCRQELGDDLPTVMGGVAVDGPYEVVLLGPADGPLHWRPATENDAYALSLCVVGPASQVLS